MKRVQQTLNCSITSTNVKVYPTRRYVSGTYKKEDALSGFDHLKSELVRNYKGLWVHPSYLDPKPRNEKPKKTTKERLLRFE